MSDYDLLLLYSQALEILLFGLTEAGLFQGATGDEIFQLLFEEVLTLPNSEDDTSRNIYRLFEENYQKRKQMILSLVEKQSPADEGNTKIEEVGEWIITYTETSVIIQPSFDIPRQVVVSQAQWYRILEFYNQNKSAAAGYAWFHGEKDLDEEI